MKPYVTSSTLLEGARFRHLRLETECTSMDLKHPVVNSIDSLRQPSPGRATASRSPSSTLSPGRAAVPVAIGKVTVDGKEPRNDVEC